MEALFNSLSKLNDPNAANVLEKACLYRSDPHSAKIKPEFILVEKKIAADKLPDKLDANKNGEDQANDSASGADSAEPVSKKQRTTGSNRKQDKKSARTTDGAIRLCPSVAKCLPCSFAASCKYSHDVKLWFDRRPVDISDNCYLYEAYGHCPFGLSCRFGSMHVKFNTDTCVYENLYDELKSANNKKLHIYNVLHADLKNKLWKKKYDFGLSDKIVKLVNDYVHTNRDTISTLKYNQNKGILQKKFTNEESNHQLENEVKPNQQENEMSSNNRTSGNRKIGPVTDEDLIRLRKCEKKRIDWKNKLYLAPLTTVGNLPFRRICKELGADVTCCEMAMSTNLLTGQASEWALLKRHESEDLFGVQLAGAYSDTMTKACQLLNENDFRVDFVDINSGCPIDLVYDKGAGCALMTRLDHFQKIVRSLDLVLDCPVTVKIRTGIKEEVRFARELVGEMKQWGVSMITLHGRTRQQRYSKLADWSYVNECAKACDPIPLFGCGDILSYHDYNAHMNSNDTRISGCMIARGALYKPWLFTEIKEQRDWDISASERFELLRKFANYGLEHWGSDTQGVETTRRFMLDWLSFLYRYIPVGVLESVPQKINERPPYFFCRNELETLMASPNCSDWIKISELLLGPVPDGFTFTPKHKANAY